MFFSRISLAVCLIYSVQRGLALECYCEAEGCAEHHVNDTCTGAKNAKCFAAIREDRFPSGEIQTVYSYGCLPGDENTILQCKGNLVPQYHARFHILCCDEEDFCNQDLEPKLAPRTTTTPPNDPLPPPGNAVNWKYVGPALGILLLVALGISVFFCNRSCRNVNRKKANFAENQALMPHWKSFLGAGSPDLEKGFAEHSMTSGSGSGCPRLVQTTVARQLQFIQNVGRGRYGEVWQARYRDDDVAVKIFSSLDMDSWQAEVDLYKTCMLRHENILGFIVADIGGTGSATQMLLVTEYHQASLYDYLRARTRPLEFHVLFKMAHSIASGLSHLHGEIVGTSSKPVIAHRDIKTKNILVKHDGVTCVIADLGLAVRKDRSKELMLADCDKRQGTRRYMAPEILDFSIRKHDFDSFLQADMYSFGLVLWELTRCSDISGIGSSYCLPYNDHAVGDDPDFSTMRHTVCVEKKRPTVSSSWSHDEHLNVLRKMMEECWNENPSARLGALNVKKKLAKTAPPAPPALSALSAPSTFLG